MTNSPATLDATEFLQQVRGVSFSQVGVFALIRAHMLLTPDLCMTRAGIDAALRVRTPFAIDIVTAVIDDLFVTDSDGAIYCPGLESDRGVTP